MKSFVHAPALLAVAGLSLAACSSNSSTTTTSTNPPATTAGTTAPSGSVPTGTKVPGTTPGSTPGTKVTGTAPSGGAVTVALAPSALGDILVDGQGNTIYVFKKDTGTTSNCGDGCTSAWPPLLGSSVTPGAGLDADDFKTTTRSDGTTQITFYGHPLYTYAGDNAPGDTNGEGFGGNWFVVDKSGTAVPKP